jgi:hypothetical protein
MLLAAALVATVAWGQPAVAQTEPSPTTAFDYSECSGALPKPDCGQEPQSAGDRGGIAQLGLFLFVALGTAAGLAYVAVRVRHGTKERARAVTGDWS